MWEGGCYSILTKVVRSEESPQTNRKGLNNTHPNLKEAFRHFATTPLGEDTVTMDLGRLCYVWDFSQKIIHPC